MEGLGKSAMLWLRLCLSALMWREGLGELCAGVEIGPGSVLMWRGWVSSVLGLRLYLTVY